MKNNINKSSDIKCDPLNAIYKWITIMGLSAYTTSKDDIDKYIFQIKRIIISCFYISTFIILIIYLLFNTEMFKNKNKLNDILISDAFSTIFECIYFITTQIKIHIYGKQTIMLFNNLRKVDKTLLITFNIQPENEKIKKMICIELIVIPLAHLTFILTNYITYNYDDDNIYLFEYIFLMLILTYNKLLQLFLANICILIKNRFKLINNEMNKFSTTYYKIYNNNNNNSDNIKQNIITNKKTELKILITTRNKLMEMTNYLNKHIGKRNLLFIAFNTVMLTFHIYNIIVTLIDTKIQWKIVYYSTTWVIFRVVNILLVVLNFTYTSEEVSTFYLFI